MPLLGRAHPLGARRRHQPGVPLIGAPVVRLEEAGSTNDVAAALATRGWPEGTVVVAGSQRVGRGRQGRPWHSPPGANLYCSLLLRPGRPVREWADLSWVVAAAVAETARAAGAPEVSLKYPNDVLARGRKLAGVLLETRTGGAGAPALIAGVGFNANLEEAQLPPQLRGAATSLLMLTGRRSALAALLAGLCAAVEDWYGTWGASGAAASRERLRAAALEIGAAGAEGDGALELRDGAAVGEGT